MTYTHETLVRFRQEELMREARRTRLARCLQPSRPWGRPRRRPCP
jgi:hypothetical protein